jgi:hypothetical protein
MNKNPTSVEVIGVYHVPEHKGISMVEVSVDTHYTGFDPQGFLKPDPERSPEAWETADDVRYLNPSGDLMIGDLFQRPLEEYETTRLVMFFHNLDIQRPLVTPFGLVALPKRRPIPERLRRIIQYHPVEK